MLMDLDRFKDVNDTLGHHNGDLLLQRIGSRLDSVLRNTATVARLGGDEFAILLPDTSDRQAVIPVVRRGARVLEGAGGGRRPRAPGRGLDRHRDVPRARPHGRRRDARRRRGHVRDQGAALGLRVLRRGAARAPPRRRPPGADRRAAPRHGRDRAGALLPAQGRPLDRQGEGRRGARPLAPPRARPAVARRVHPAGRALEPAAPDDALPARHGAAPGQRVARQGHRGERRGEPLDAEHARPAPAERPRAPAHELAPAGRLARARDHRVDDHGRPPPRDDDPVAALEDGRAAVDRRLRDGLLVARLPAGAARSTRSRSTSRS